MFATDYVYDISPSADAPYLSGGYVVTNCDQCTLTSANVVGWSLIQAVTTPPSVITSSSLPLSTVSVFGTGLTATSSGLFFNFTYNPKGTDVLFSSGEQFTSSYTYVDISNAPTDSNIGPPTGETVDCGTTFCVGKLMSGNIELGTFAKLEAPELSISEMSPSG